MSGPECFYCSTSSSRGVCEHLHVHGIVEGLNPLHQKLNLFGYVYGQITYL